MPDSTRTTAGWPWRDVVLAIVGLIAGGYLGLDTLRLDVLSGWKLVGGYALFAALFLAFAVFRPRYRSMFVGAYVGLTIAVVVTVFS